MNERPLVVAYGGGTNSTAMLCGFLERDIKPDLILFADTGGEMPETYQHVRDMDGICRAWWGIDIKTVNAKYKGEFEGLEKECIRGKRLPSLAYGFKTCSQKHKIKPQEYAIREIYGKQSIIQAVGYDAGESHRVKDYSTDRKQVWFPLIEWQWRRQECVDAIQRHNLPLPGKSACFFCPAMKRHEIIKLKQNHPELYDRAVEMERLANSEAGKNRNPRGLTGRSLMWSDITAQDEAQSKLWDYLDANDESPIPCGCYDG